MVGGRATLTISDGYYVPCNAEVPRGNRYGPQERQGTAARHAAVLTASAQLPRPPKRQGVLGQTARRAVDGMSNKLRGKLTSDGPGAPGGKKGQDDWKQNVMGPMRGKKGE
jgi:hypothetical protein